jgi:hypothetical protein
MEKDRWLKKMAPKRMGVTAGRNLSALGHCVIHMALHLPQR